MVFPKVSEIYLKEQLRLTLTLFCTITFKVVLLGAHTLIPVFLLEFPQWYQIFTPSA
jgi:hypothetical protein